MNTPRMLHSTADTKRARTFNFGPIGFCSVPVHSDVTGERHMLGLTIDLYFFMAGFTIQTQPR